MGRGTGAWSSRGDLDLEPSAYIRTPDGFLTAMHAVVRSAEAGGETVHEVPIFNPGGNRNQVSWLRLANLTEARVRVRIEGRDDDGRDAPSGEVSLTLPAHGALRISAQALESGRGGVDGAPGRGRGQVAALRHRRWGHRGGEPAREPHRAPVPICRPRRAVRRPRPATATTP